jgi:hypothetical protein
MREYTGFSKTTFEPGAAIIKTNGSSRSAPKFKLVKFDDLKVGKGRLYLVKSIVPRFGLTLIWGPPKCGKSFFAFDMMLHVALGWEYRRHRITQGTVVYCAFEGADGFRLRAEAFRRQHKLQQTPAFYLVGTSMDLVMDHAALITAISTHLGKEQPVAVVLDTLNRSLRGSESKDEDMAAYVRAADAIREVFACAVIIVHHCGHNDARPRGHSSLLGAIDAQIAVARDPSSNVVATVERMKDGMEGETVVSRLEQAEIGCDEDGDPLTSCVIVPVHGEAIPAPKLVALPKSARLALRALDEALVDAGEPAPASNHIPPGVRVVTVDLWRQYTYQRGISAADCTDRARQKAFKDASTRLITGSEVAIWGEHVWRTQ